MCVFRLKKITSCVLSKSYKKTSQLHKTHLDRMHLQLQPISNSTSLTQQNTLNKIEFSLDKNWTKLKIIQTIKLQHKKCSTISQRKLFQRKYILKYQYLHLLLLFVPNVMIPVIFSLHTTFVFIFFSICY